MPNIELETFKQDWQNHHRQSAPVLADDAVLAGLNASSGTLDAQWRRSGRVDIVLKGVLLVACLVMLGLHRPSGVDAWFMFAVLVACGLGLLMQLRLLRAVPTLDLATGSTIEVHRVLLQYFERFGWVSALVHSLTAPLFFAVGSSAYLLAKYGSFPPPGADDLLVASIGLSLAFMLHFLPLRLLQRRQQRILRATLEELQDDAIDPARLSVDRRSMKRWMAVLLLLLAVGLALLVVVLRA